ncbi:MAG TPA: YciI family protein [Luteimonas sp.]|nr:YciI family protein [Luteimonas sp.]
MNTTMSSAPGHAGLAFARWTFRLAAAYGVLTLAPMYWFESSFATDNPPALTHPEFFYGFLGVALAWQVLFWTIGRDPLRHRPAMVAAILEKFGYGAAVLVLQALGRANAPVLTFAVVDLLLGCLFVASFMATSTRAPSGGSSRAPAPQAGEDNGSTADATPLYLVTTLRTARFQANAIDPHYAFLDDLRRAGSLVMSGRFGDGSGGAYVLRAANLDAAGTIARQDPLHATGSSRISVREWYAR